MTSITSKTYDAIIIGGGIAGMQAALDLADQDFKVAVIEQDTTIGGKMIRLDKVFPTLDCASCITTPKMASVAHHKNIKILTMCNVQSIGKENDANSAGNGEGKFNSFGISSAKRNDFGDW